MSSEGNKRLLASLEMQAEEHSGAYVIVRTAWNAAIVDELEKGCTDVLKKKGVSDIKVINVPGAVEIPFAVKAYWDHMKYRDEKPVAFIVLGCVIKGDTPHFEYVCDIITQGTLQLNLTLPVPTIFGVLTVLNSEQAMERIGGIHGHKGEEAALTALSMTGFLRSLRPRPQC